MHTRPECVRLFYTIWALHQALVSAQTLATHDPKGCRVMRTSVPILILHECSRIGISENPSGLLKLLYPFIRLRCIPAHDPLAKDTSRDNRYLTARGLRIPPSFALSKRTSWGFSCHTPGMTVWHLGQVPCAVK